jgi:sulfide:quinone oxidoreductase
MATVVVLGGGFGGASAAIAARDLLPAEHEVIVVDRVGESYLCGANPAIIVGRQAPVTRSLTDLVDRGIRVVSGEIQRLDIAAGRIETSAGDLAWDHLVLALGVEYDWDAVPGSRDAFSFYDRNTTERLQRRIASFDSGSIVIGIGGSPYRCPPAPFEAALMIDAHLRARGSRENADITVAIPEPKPLAVAGEDAARRIGGLLADRDITLLTGRHVSRVEESEVVFDDGTQLTADVAITVPVHRVPAVVAASGITEGAPFVPVDRNTLETGVPGVFAIGDINTIPVGEKAIPKAGVFAAGQGRHVAAVIAHRLGVGGDPGSYDGVGACFLMLGPDTGAELGGNFFAPGGPDVALGEASAEGRRAKTAFEEAWSDFSL